MVLPQAMAWVQYWFHVLSLKFYGKSKKIAVIYHRYHPLFACMHWILSRRQENLSPCVFYAKTPPWCLRKKPSLSVNCYFFLPTAAEICGGILFSHSFCSDLPTTQCQTPHGKNYTDAWKETQKSRKNVEVDSVHRSSHDGSSKLLKKSTTHICPKDNSRNSRDLFTCCINLTHMF